MPGTIGTTHRKHIRHQRLGRYRKDRVSRFSLWLAREAARLSAGSQRALRDSLRNLGLLSPAELEGAGTLAAAGIVEMQGSPDLTFAQGATMAGGPDLTIASNAAISRSAGDFTADGFAVGPGINVSGANLDPANTGRFVPTIVLAGSITIPGGVLVDEGPISGAAIAADATITRSAGDWSADGFAVGDRVRVTGTASNDGDYTIARLVSATVLEVVGATLAAEAAVSSVGFARIDADGQ